MSKPVTCLSAILLTGTATAAMAVAKVERAVPRLTPAAAVAGHCAAWNATSRIERDRLLARVFAPDGVYNDPTPPMSRGALR